MHTAKSHYRPEIDGLRALAVLAVIVFHLNAAWLPGGFAGVDVFFVISGFLVASIILRDQAEGSFHLGKFYQRRIARILPAFLAAACATLLAAWMLYSTWDFAAAGASFGAAVLSIANVHLLGLGDYFELSEDAQPFLHCWSLSVEEQFYLLFPALLWLIGKLGHNGRLAVLTILAVLSFACGIILTYWRAPWAFYLLPSRAWELLAGGLLALVESRRTAASRKILPRSCGLGILLVGSAFFLLHESRHFPGWLALWPVVGAVLIVRQTSDGWSRIVLGWAPLAAVGRLSYSLYLWHWPVFSMVDYICIFSTGLERLALKISLTAALSIGGYFLVEQPCRKFFNNPTRKWPAFALLACSLLVLAPLGYHVRYTHYLDGSDGKDGQLALGAVDSPRTLMLMGDSQASMYANTLRDIAVARNSRFLVISIAGKDPLPVSSGPPGELWLSCLAKIQREKPECVVLACDWIAKLEMDPERLQKALAEMKPHAGRIILLTMPPRLPLEADRPAIRQGSRPPFREEIHLHDLRKNLDSLLRNCAGTTIHVVDINTLFTGSDGEIFCFDESGRRLFTDRYHLSEHGTRRVRPALEAALDAP